MSGDLSTLLGRTYTGNWRKTETPKANAATVYAVKTVTNDVELIRMLTDVVMRSRFLKLKAKRLCLQKLALTGDNEVPVPDNIQAYVKIRLSGITLIDYKRPFLKQEHRME